MSRVLEAPVIDVALQLRGRNAASLIAEAKRRKRDPGELLSDIIEAVIADDLWKAVLE